MHITLPWLDSIILCPKIYTQTAYGFEYAYNCSMHGYRASKSHNTDNHRQRLKNAYEVWGLPQKLLYR